MILLIFPKGWLFRRDYALDDQWTGRNCFMKKGRKDWRLRHEMS
jgi:hypothetical protein